MYPHPTLLANTSKGLILLIMKHMNKTKVKVDSLKKITLSIESGSTPGASDLMNETCEFAFIFGIGMDGLSPFEFKLANKSVGEEIFLKVHRSEIHSMFQHITVPLPELANNLTSVYLKFEITQIVAAEGREIIRAMAEISECGSHCCDCH